MKKLFSLLFILMIGIITTACSSENAKSEDIVKFIKEYKTEQYNIKDPANPPTGIQIGEKVKKYLSKDALRTLNANRTFQIAPDFAKKANKSIKLEDGNLEKEKKNKDGITDYQYTLKLKVYDEKSSKTIEKKGKLSISNDSELKITRDWEDNNFEGNEK